MKKVVVVLMLDSEEDLSWLPPAIFLNKLLSSASVPILRRGVGAPPEPAADSGRNSRFPGRY